MRIFFDKLFCKHKWISHEKVNREPELVSYIQKKYEVTQIRDEIIKEVMFCENCGQVKYIKY